MRNTQQAREPRSKKQQNGNQYTFTDKQARARVGVLEKPERINHPNLASHWSADCVGSSESHARIPRTQEPVTVTRSDRTFLPANSPLQLSPTLTYGLMLVTPIISPGDDASGDTIERCKECRSLPTSQPCDPRLTKRGRLEGERKGFWRSRCPHE